MIDSVRIWISWMAPLTMELSSRWGKGHWDLIGGAVMRGGRAGGLSECFRSLLILTSQTYAQGSLPILLKLLIFKISLGRDFPSIH